MTLTEIIARLEELEQKAGNGDGEYVSFLVALRTHARALLTAAKLSEARGRVCEAAKQLVGSPVARGTTPVKSTLKADAVRAALVALAAAEKEPT